MLIVAIKQFNLTIMCKNTTVHHQPGLWSLKYISSTRWQQSFKGKDVSVLSHILHFDEKLSGVSEPLVTFHESDLNQLKTAWAECEHASY